MKKLKQFEQKWLHEVDQLINENLDNTNFTIRRLAFQLNLSSASFYRRIIKLTGTPPNDYIRQKKLDTARQLLADRPDYNFRELATKVGYLRQDYFAKIFLESAC